MAALSDLLPKPHHEDLRADLDSASRLSMFAKGAGDLPAAHLSVERSRRISVDSCRLFHRQRYFQVFEFVYGTHRVWFSLYHFVPLCHLHVARRTSPFLGSSNEKGRRTRCALSDETHKMFRRTDNKRSEKGRDLLRRPIQHLGLFSELRQANCGVPLPLTRKVEDDWIALTPGHPTKVSANWIYGRNSITIVSNYV